VLWPAPYSQNLATQAGLEPATVRLEGGCSILLSYWARVSGHKQIGARRLACVADDTGARLLGSPDTLFHQTPCYKSANWKFAFL
jgi:hypothetical protein